MATVKVYKYETTDAKLGQPVQSKRMGTVRYIASVHGWKVQGSEMEVDVSKVDADGKTEVDFSG
jgi:hypothetical protein